MPPRHVIFRNKHCPHVGLTVWQPVGLSVCQFDCFFILLYCLTVWLFDRLTVLFCYCMTVWLVLPFYSWNNLLFDCSTAWKFDSGQFENLEVWLIKFSLLWLSWCYLQIIQYRSRVTVSIQAKCKSHFSQIFLLSFPGRTKPTPAPTPCSCLSGPRPSTAWPRLSPADRRWDLSHGLRVTTVGAIVS